MNAEINTRGIGHSLPSTRRGLIASFLALSLLLLMQAGCATQYSSEAIHGKVVDAKSKQPVENAIIAVDWLVVGMEGMPLQQLAVMETVTDKNGKFEIPPWGPKRMVVDSYATIRYTQPTLRIFKSGYIPIVVANNIPGGPPESHLISFGPNGSTFELESFQGSLKEYADKFMPVNLSLFEIYSDSTKFCGWRSLPRLIIALDKQERIFRANGIQNSHLWTLDQFSPKSHCGYPSEVFKEYLK
jgi:hypothetical protein